MHRKDPGYYKDESEATVSVRLCLGPGNGDRDMLNVVMCEPFSDSEGGDPNSIPSAEGSPLQVRKGWSFAGVYDYYRCSLRTCIPVL